jgi:hypothetical protein
MQFRFSLLVPSAAALLALAPLASYAAVSITGTQTYTQSFDTLATSGASNPWTNDSTLAGWSLFNSTGAAITAYGGDNGASNAGNFWSYGSTASPDRALGSLGSGGTYFGSPATGAVAGYLAVALTNNTGAALDAFNVQFDGEQWRNGGNTSAQTMVIQYGFGNTFGSVATWTAPGAGFTFVSPTVGATAAALDGNAAANRIANLGGTVNTSWANGSTLWVRWIENNDTGNDHGLAIDNFSLSVVAVPEPSTYAMLLAGLAAVSFIARRQRS